MSIVGIDPAAEVLGVAVIDDAGRLVEQRMLTNTAKGWNAVARLASGCGAMVGIEGLYGWGLALAFHLTDAGIGVCAVEPWQTAQLRRARPLHRKDDLTDAVWAAQAVRLWDLTPVVMSRDLVDLGVYLTHHEGLVRAQTQRAQRIHNILGRIDPLYRRGLGRIRSRRHWDALSSYDHTRLPLAAATIRDIATDGYTEWGRLRLSETVLSGLLPPIGRLLCDRFEGIGPTRAAQILVHSGDIRRFPNDSAYAAFCGLAPTEHSSGRTSRRSATKGGQRQLHTVFIGAINTQVQQDRKTRAGYVYRRIDAGDAANHAKIAAARKLTRKVYRTLLQNQHLT